MNIFWRRIFLPLLQVLAFFFIYFFVGNWVLETFVWPAIDHLPKGARIGLHPFLELDYGRIVNRLFQFLWTILIYTTFLKFVDKKPLKESILFKPHHKRRTFISGALFGGFLVLSLIGLSIVTKTITIKAIHLYPDDIIETTLLYIFCMAITAFAEELALRGYILENLKNSWGTHWAVWISSLIFSLIYIQESYYYAYTAFVAGLLLGYGYSWYGIYYCIGWHFVWNLIESLVFSGKIILYRVNDPFLAGDKAMSPDQEGFLVLPILVTGLAILLAFHKTEWRLTEKQQ